MVRVCGARVYALMFAAHNAFLTGAKAVIPVTIKGYSSAASTGGVTSVTIPSHSAGDMVLIWAGGGYANTSWSPVKPAAGGTVPTWTTIDAPGTFQASGYTISTGATITSGNWADARIMIAVVLSGQNATNPIGGHSTGNSGGGNYITGSINSTAVTMSKTDGSSKLLTFIGGYNGGPWSAGPATGYTSLLDSNGLGGNAPTYEPHRLVSKNDTTSGGAAFAVGTLSGCVWESNTIEIVT